MELTKEYFDEQLTNLATKDDLKNFATKEDLKGLATKEDLKATDNRVADLQKFVQENLVTKQELDKGLNELPTREDFSRLQASVDGIAKQLTGLTDEQKITASRTTRMEEWIIKAAPKIGVEYKP